MSEQVIISVINSVAEKQSLYNYKYEIVGESNKTGYSSDITFVRVFAKNKNHKDEVLELAIKSSKKWEQFGITMQGVFNKEVYIYSQVKTAFEKLQIDYKIDNVLRFMPQCYYTLLEPKRQVLVFENLNAKGFDLLDLGKSWPLEGTIKALEAYGKWHALSFALKALQPRVFQALVIDNANVFAPVPWEKSFLNQVVLEYVKIQNKLIADNFDPASKLNFSKSDVSYAVTDMFFDNDCKEKCVVLHGDCWSNNYLLKFKKNSQNPEEICIIDWQCTRLASPVFDISHYIFATANLQNQQSLSISTFLKVYYKSFSETLNLFSCDANDIFSYAELLGHWKKYSKFGLFLGCFINKFSFAKKNRSEAGITKTSNDFEENMFLFEIENMDDYYYRLKDNITFYYNSIN